MASLDDLSPDQRAVLQLLLKQRKSYGELGALLRIDVQAVRSRAAAALGALGPAIDNADRVELTDWLLGQQDPEEAADTAALLRESPAALEWASVVADALEDGGLQPRAEPSPGPEPVQSPEPVAEPFEPDPHAQAPATLPGFDTPPPSEPRPSRLGGLLLLAGAAAIIVVLLVIFLGRGGDEDSAGTSVAQTQTTAATQTRTAATTGQVTVEAQVNMTPPGGGKSPLGVAQFFTDGTDHGVTVQAQGLKRNGSGDVYALWLTGGPEGASSLLGFAPSKVGRNGRFSGSITLPENSADYGRIELTRETNDNPTQPGTAVLRGSLR